MTVSYTPMPEPLMAAMVLLLVVGIVLEAVSRTRYAPYLTRSLNFLRGFIRK